MKTYHHYLLVPTFAAGFLAMFVAGNVSAADDATPPAEKPKRWETVATAGATLTRGNSESFLVNGSIDTKRSWTNDEALLGASAGYGDNTTTVNGTKVDTTTQSYIRGYGQWNHLFTPKLYGGVRVTGEHDDTADLAYRAILSPLAGYYLIKETNTFLAGEIGPSFVTEKFFDVSADNYVGLRIGERFQHKFNSGAKIWESLEWIPKVEDFQNYLLTAEAGVSAPISKGLSLNLVLQDSYKSVPAPGKLKNDLKLIAGVAYNF